MVQTFNVDMKDMEVRKVEEVEWEINDKTFRSLMIHFDDVECNRLVFKDKIIENKDKYKRGQVGTLTITISTDEAIKTGKNGNPYITEKTTITIHEWKPNKEA